MSKDESGPFLGSLQNYGVPLWDRARALRSEDGFLVGVLPYLREHQGIAVLM